ncbi:uncharacterized protein [Amphiura filiformis]|uniref:uncharacterized protein n=1 Tax=Amphiura filiformis TaxID=82378 RepID=UPI003B2123B0
MLEEYRLSAKSSIARIQGIQQQAAPMVEDGSDADFLSFYATMKGKIDQMCFKEPLTYLTSLECLSFQSTELTTRDNLVGMVGEIREVQIAREFKSVDMKLVNEYGPKQCDQHHEFYGIDIGYRRQFVLPIAVLAVTDRLSNKVVILDASSLNEKQRIRGSQSKTGSELVHPSDVAFSSEGLSLAIVDQTNKVKIYKMYTGSFQFERTIDTCPAIQSTTTRSSVTVDSVNHLTVGKSQTAVHNWLMRFEWDGVSSLDDFRISPSPSFLAFTPDHEQLLVSDTASGTVVSLNRGGSTAFVIDAKSFCQQTPTGVCCDTDGCIFVASVACSKEKKVISSVHKYSPSGSHIACLGDFPHPIYGIVFTKEGKLAAACGDTVKLFDVPKTDNTERQRRTLECSICLHRFRNPKTLPCLHSFCEDCLTNYAPLGTKTLACPLCKERIEVPNGDASTFKSNFHLKELVEEVVLTDEVTKHSTEIICNCCDEELVAVSKCLDCDQYLCSPCLKAHRRFSALREHAIATFDEIKTGKIRPRSSIKRQLMCNRHPGNKAEIFCTTCEMPICHICATLKHKSPDHECIEASEATESRRKHASEGLVKLDAVKTRFTEAEINANKTYTDSQEHIAQLKDSIEERCKCLIDKIEADKGKLFESLEVQVDKESRMLEEYRLSAKSSIARIQGIQQQAAPMVEDGSDADFLSFYATMKGKIDQMCFKEPLTYLTSLECLSFQSTELTTRDNLVGMVGEIREVQIAREFKSVDMKLVNEYGPKQCDQHHEFYGIDIGYRRQFVLPIAVLAVTDRSIIQ